MRFCLLLLLLVGPVWAERWPESLAERLANQPIRSAQTLESVIRAQGQDWSGSSAPWLLDLRDGTQGVFRSEDEPWGSQAEVAGFLFTRWLGLEIVPPTATRTLRKEEWPAGVRWPFSTDSLGSMQLYVKSKPATGELDAMDRADNEVVSFVMGRYDNHDGNLLMDTQGRIFMVDFENCLEVQKAQYGQVAYARRGAPRKDLASASVLKAFPFDAPETMVNPTLDAIQAKFTPWWIYWPEGMKTLWEHTQRLEDKTVRYAVWDHRLWVQARARSRHAPYTDRYRVATMEKLAQLDVAGLQLLLPAPFTGEHATGMMERAGQVLRAWRKT